ncbi:TRAP transporter small permease subunit [Thiomicrorhabdus sp. Milos-T2]|uniref:TRAP transporter small permease subunit n=1 Tax=Thiomicrorhabdus sp. Milos-T2 TaxID=90814 RepID=UPI00068EDDE1|nr:TRAP transporter small permease subunit [Thiomicrorhabdus sp. Milos-T2]
MPLSPFSAFVTQFIVLQNRFQKQFGKWVAWGSLSLVLISALVVVLRYGFNTGSIALQESIMYNHAILFMLGIAYTYEQDKHVRVDVFYAQMNEYQQAWVNFLGTLILALPVMLFVIWSGWEYVATSWQIKESSTESGGLAYLYLLKTLILIMAGLVIMQSLAILAKSGLTLFSKAKLDIETDIESDIDTNLEIEGKL